MDTEQQRRIAENESRFRDLNARMTEAMAEFHGERPGGVFTVLCECALSECADMIELSADEYEHVRSENTWHLVRPDHIIPQVEQPVEQHDTYWVIEKLGVGAEVAEENS